MPRKPNTQTAAMDLPNDTAVAEVTDTTVISKKEFAQRLQEMTEKLQEAATRHLTAERLIRVFLGEATRNPEYYECTFQSIVNAMTLCAQTGLEPGGPMGYVYLIPRWNKHIQKKEINWQLGYKGLAKLAQRSGEVARVNASPIYKWELEQELYEYQHEPPTIRHAWTPDPPELKDGDIVGGYAVCELKDGSRIQCWLSRDAIIKRKNKSSSKSKAIWDEWFPEMCRKTLLRALLNGGLVPLAPEAHIALQADPDDWTRPTEAVVHTKATRHFSSFLPKKEPEAIETTAEKVIGFDFYKDAMDAAKSLGATDGEGGEIDAALKAADLENKFVSDWTRNDADKFIATLEEMKGA